MLPRHARAITVGAPQAQQSADRWHVLHNLCKYIYNWLYRHQTHPCEPDHSPSSTPFATPPSSALPPTLPQQDIRHVRCLLSRQAPREIRLEQYTRVKALSAVGKTHQSIVDARGCLQSTSTALVSMTSNGFGY